MGRYAVQRLVQLIPLLLGITIITFGLANLIPGSPVSDLQFSPATRPEDVERIRQQLGLDQPVHRRYLQWLGHLVQGDLGISLVTYRPVSTTILERLPNTLLLTASALTLSLLFSIPVGIYAAMRRNSLFDHLSTIAAVGGMAVPTFWLGLMVIILFSVKFQEWGLPSLPAGGTHDLRGSGGMLDRLEHLLMPAVVLAFVQTAAWTRYIRSQMIDVLRQDYIQVAYAKGIQEKLVIVRHGLRNALLPLITLLALDIPTLFSGAVVTEQIFAWNGIGRLMVESAFSRDYTVAMGIVLIVSLLTIMANFVADMAYGWLDPRIRHD